MSDRSEKACMNARLALDSMRYEWEIRDKYSENLRAEVARVEQLLAAAQEDKPCVTIQCLGCQDDGWRAFLNLDGGDGYAYVTASHGCRDAAMIAAFHHAAVSGWRVRID